MSNVVIFRQYHEDALETSAFNLPPVPDSNIGDTSFHVTEDVGDFGICDFVIEMGMLQVKGLLLLMEQESMLSSLFEMTKPTLYITAHQCSSRIMGTCATV